MSSILLSTIEYLNKYHIKAKKYKGQNFLLDDNLCKKIVSLTDLKNQILLEFGAGPGNLTRAALSLHPKKLIAIEIDKQFLPILLEIQKKYPSLEIRNTDALTVKIRDFTNKKIFILGNLPYNIASQLLIKVLDEIELVEGLIITIQKEMAERIYANPHNKAYGIISVLCQARLDIKKYFDIAPNLFYPRPQVFSTTVSMLTKEKQLKLQEWLMLKKILRYAFGKRRKMIKTSLSQLFPDIKNFLYKISIDPKLRAENLTVEDYIRLSKYIIK